MRRPLPREARDRQRDGPETAVCTVAEVSIREFAQALWQGEQGAGSALHK